MKIKKDMSTPVPPEVLSVPVSGFRLEGRTLGEALGDGPTLLAFLRHLG